MTNPAAERHREPDEQHARQSGELQRPSTFEARDLFLITVSSASSCICLSLA